MVYFTYWNMSFILICVTVEKEVFLGEVFKASHVSQLDPLTTDGVVLVLGFVPSFHVEQYTVVRKGDALIGGDRYSQDSRNVAV